jgi:hypothetical protein
MLDDLLIDRCNKDEIVYNSTERAVARMEERVKAHASGAGGGSGKPKGGKKGKGGKGGGGKGGGDPDEDDPLTSLLKEAAKCREAIRNHNVRVLAGEARLHTTFAWWRRNYLPR